MHIPISPYFWCDNAGDWLSVKVGGDLSHLDLPHAEMTGAERLCSREDLWWHLASLPIKQRLPLFSLLLLLLCNCDSTCGCCRRMDALTFSVRGAIIKHFPGSNKTTPCCCCKKSPLFLNYLRSSVRLIEELGSSFSHRSREANDANLSEHVTGHGSPAETSIYSS